ncbi:hypothetical protein ACR0ST_10270 [Aliidiomarina sp. Khilg15.8]
MKKIMEFKVLDTKSEAQSTCFLVSASLENYVKNIPSDYDSYEIQRAIVNNSYLDRLVYTIFKKGHIPTITLITDDTTDSIEKGFIRDFKILDGLQRTHRLKIIFETKEIFLENVNDINQEISDFQLKRRFRDQLSEIGSSGNIFIAIKEFYYEKGLDELNKCFSENTQWFEVWSGLSPEDEVKKMLVLNAGHKPVNIKHQLELLFQNVYPIFESVKSGDITIVREKEVSSAAFSKGRAPGTYHFSHLISALISFFEEKPISTNSNFISKVQDDDQKLKEFSEIFSYSFLEYFIRSVHKLDVAAHLHFGDVGSQWIGREVSLTSIFAVIGYHSQNIDEFVSIIDKLSSNFDKCNLRDYESCRNSVDLAKVNIGNINKKNIFKAFNNFISEEMSNPINWKDIFEGDTNEKG